MSRKQNLTFDDDQSLFFFSGPPDMLDGEFKFSLDMCGLYFTCPKAKSLLVQSGKGQMLRLSC